MDAAGDEALRVALELLQAVLRQPDLVGLVVDREVRLVAEPRRLPAENPAAGGVEGEDPDRAGDVAEQVLEPRAHLPRRLVRKRDGEDLVRLRALRGDEMRDAARERAGLPRAGSGDDEHGALCLQHGLPLGGIEVGEVLLRLQGGLAPPARC